MLGPKRRFAVFLPILSPNSRSTKGGIISKALEESFGVGRSPLLGGNTLGHTSFGKKSLQEEEMEEGEIRV